MLTLPADVSGKQDSNSRQQCGSCSWYLKECGLTGSSKHAEASHCHPRVRLGSHELYQRHVQEGEVCTQLQDSTLSSSPSTLTIVKELCPTQGMCPRTYVHALATTINNLPLYAFRCACKHAQFSKLYCAMHHHQTLISDVSTHSTPFICCIVTVTTGNKTRAEVVC